MSNSIATTTNNVLDLAFQFDTGSFIPVPTSGLNSTLINIPSTVLGVNWMGYSRWSSGWDEADAYMYYAVYSGSLTEAQLQQNFQAFVTSSYT
jgi:hypothetical protein